MGKPYNSELLQLDKTYSAVLAADITELAEIISHAVQYPMFFVGSGGSLSVAHYVSNLNRHFSNTISRAITPLELIEAGPRIKDISLGFISAGGNNIDICTAFQNSILREYKNIFSITARPENKLIKISRKYNFTHSLDFQLPILKDGFLATNSLLAFCVLFYRAYCRAYGVKEALPKNLDDFISPQIEIKDYIANLKKNCAPLWEKGTLIVLYSVLCQSAAIDIESKFTEAALGSVQLADLRNFAHGRHHWLAKRGDSSAVIVLTTDIDNDLAKKTIRLFPDSITTVHLNFSGNDSINELKALLTMLHVVNFVGEAIGIDPGRPGVPDFGSRIYKLSMANMSKIKTDEIAITRKIKASSRNIKEETRQLKAAYNSYVTKLENTAFQGIVFDYDGTLCDGRNRFGQIDDHVEHELQRLLECGIIIGIATGRGKSVRVALRKSLSENFWSKVVIGYYNGAECGLLTDDQCPNASEDASLELQAITDKLQGNEILSDLCTYTVRKSQVTIEPISYINIKLLWSLINELVASSEHSGVRVFSSSHSIDILAPSISKMGVLEYIKEKFFNSSPVDIMCVGDMGFWPGNDCELLKHPYSLSVDEVSPDLTSCWNLAPAGHRGVQATVDYLKAMTINNGYLRFYHANIGKDI